MKIRFLSTLFLSLLAFESGAAAQGNKILFSFHGGPTSGKDSTGGGSLVGVTLGGHGSTIVSPGAGATNEQVADQIDAALKAKGYTTARPNKNEVCVQTGPGGKPLTTGGGIGDTDTGLGGINVKVKKPVVPAPAVKPAGVAIPKFVPKLRAAVGGILRWLIDIVDPQGNRRQQQLQLPFQQGDTTDQLNQRLQQMLQQGGFWFGTCYYPDLLRPAGLVECWQLDRMRDGSRIDHVVMLGEAPIEILPMQLQGGATPVFGAVDYGTGFGPGLPFAPWIRPGINPPQIGSFFDVFVEVGMPNVLGGLLISGNKAEMHLPFLGPDAWLLVDPLGPTLWLPAQSDMFGVMPLRTPIPPNPNLAGLELAWQAIAVDPKGGLALSSGLTTVVGK